MRETKAITLIALVVTVIVLLILAVVSLNLIMGEDGIISRATLASFVTEMKKIEENVILKKNANAMKLIEDDSTSPEIFEKKMSDLNDIEFVSTLKQEILYMRDGQPSDKQPAEYDVEDFDSSDALSTIYVVDKETGDNKENTYLWDPRTSVVFKIPPTRIRGKIYHSYQIASLAKGGTPEEPGIEKDLIVKEESGEVEVSGIKYYAPNLKGFNKNSTSVIYYSDNTQSNVEKSLTEYLEMNESEAYKIDQDGLQYTFYDYQNKKWANVKTNANGIEAWWVWIPRYAYKIDASNNMLIKFVDINGHEFGTNTLEEGYTVHPSFTVDGHELKGLWMSKYEASFTNQVPVDGVLAPDMTGFDAQDTYIEMYDLSNNTFTGEVKLADADLNTINQDKNWYDYQNKKWANIKTNANGIEAWWVWIPRYAYRIEADNTMNIIFIDLKDKPFDKVNYPDGKLPEGYTIHPAFTVDGKALKGIWMSKYEASFTNQVPVDGVLAPDMTGFDKENTYIEKYDLASNSFTEEIKLADADLNTINQDKNWYDYQNKKWANIKTNANGIEAWWVWIPRYAYRIEADNTMNIIFINENDKPLDKVNYPDGKLPDSYTVHPSFNVDGHKLKGIWMSKYEASQN